MELINQIEPGQLILAGMALLVLGVLVGRKMPARWRWLWIIPALAFAGVALRVASGIREDARRSQAIFAQLNTYPEITSQEAGAFQTLAGSSARVQLGVLELAFANPINAGPINPEPINPEPINAVRALPRLEFLLQATLQLDAGGARRGRLWKKVVKPALRKQPAPEVILLAAATAAIGGYGSNQAARVLGQMAPLLESETNAEQRALALGLFVPLAEFAPTNLTVTAANLLLAELLQEPNPMGANLMAGTINAAGSRRVRELQRVASQLHGLPARQFAEGIIPAMENQTNASRMLALGKVLLAVKTELDPNQRDRVLTNMIFALPRSRGGVLPGRAAPLIGLADVLSSPEAEKALNQLLSLVKKEPDPWWRAELASPFKALAPRLDDEALLRLAEPLEDYSSNFVEDILHRIPPEQAYLWLDRVVDKILNTPNEARRNGMLPRVKPLVARLTPDRAGKLADELWSAFLADQDDTRWTQEVSCLDALAPQLTDAMAAALGRRVVEVMKSRPGFRLPLLMRILTPLMERCDAGTVPEAAACVRAVFEKPAKPFNYFAVEGFLQKDFLLRAQLTPAQMNQVLEPLVAEIESYESPDPDRYCGPVTCLAHLAGQLTPEQVERVGHRLVYFYTQRPNVFGTRSLNLLATNLAMTPYQAQRLVDIVLPEVLRGRNPASDNFFNCLAACARRLAPEQLEAVCTNLISAIKQGREPVWTPVYARALRPFAEQLGPGPARRLAEQLLQIPAGRGNPAGLVAIMDSAGGPADLLPDWVLPTRFIERLESERSRYRLEAWSRSLAALLARMDPAEARIVGDQLAARCAEQGRMGPVAFEEQTANALRYASRPALIRILQTPFAVGGLRRIALRAWELKMDHSLEGDFWRFVSETTTTNAF